MRLVDFTAMGFKNLWRRKLRTILTMVGVAIGAFSIVIMMSLALALRESYTKQLEEWGSLTLIRINANSWDYDDDKGIGLSKTAKLDDTTVTKIKNLEYVRAVTPILNLDGHLKCGQYEGYFSVNGIDPESVQYFGLPDLESGEMISNSNPNGVLLCHDIYFYNPRRGYFGKQPEIDLMNDRIKYTFDNTYDENVIPKYQDLKVCGVMVEANSEMGYTSYAPLETVKRWYKEKQKSLKGADKVKALTYSSILVSVEDTSHVVDVQKQIKEMGFNSTSRADELSNVTDMSNTLQMALGGIGAISLLVSAIGIANTMIMSIYERTKEIGVMKVLGCVVSDIRKLFLFEAGIIGFLGGILGLGLSYGVSYLLNTYGTELGGQLGITSGGNLSTIPLWLALGAILFSVFVGMVSGLYPAIKATKIKAIEAMRSAN